MKKSTKYIGEIIVVILLVCIILLPQLGKFGKNPASIEKDNKLVLPTNTIDATYYIDKLKKEIEPRGYSILPLPELKNDETNVTSGSLSFSSEDFGRFSIQYSYYTPTKALIDITMFADLDSSTDEFTSLLTYLAGYLDRSLDLSKFFDKAKTYPLGEEPILAEFDVFKYSYFTNSVNRHSVFTIK